MENLNPTHIEIFEIESEPLNRALVWYRNNLNQAPEEINSQLEELLENTMVFSDNTDETINELTTREVLNKLTVPKLRDLAEEFKVEIPKTFKKKQIISTLLSRGQNPKYLKPNSVFTDTIQTGAGISTKALNSAKMTLKLLKIGALAQRYQLLKSKQRLPKSYQKSIRRCCNSAVSTIDEYSKTTKGRRFLKKIGTSMIGGADPLTTGLLAGGVGISFMVLLYVIYRLLRGPKKLQGVAMESYSLGHGTRTATPSGTAKIGDEGGTLAVIPSTSQYGVIPKASPAYGLTGSTTQYTSLVPVNPYGRSPQKGPSSDFLYAPKKTVAPEVVRGARGEVQYGPMPSSRVESAPGGLYTQMPRRR